MRSSVYLLLVAATLAAHVLPISTVPLTPHAYSDPAEEYYGWGPMYVSRPAMRTRFRYDFNGANRYPNTTLGGVVVEGPFPYKNGPAIWNDSFTSGAYGASAFSRQSLSSLLPRAITAAMAHMQQPPKPELPRASCCQQGGRGLLLNPTQTRAALPSLPISQWTTNRFSGRTASNSMVQPSTLVILPPLSSPVLLGRIILLCPRCTRHFTEF
jgi:hypothetical protein